MKLKLFVLAGVAALALSQPGSAQKPAYGTWGYDAASMDRSVKPGDDFWSYVNGAWAARTPIASDRTYVGIDSVLNDQIDRDVRAIVEDMAKDPARSGRIGSQVGALYNSWMDEGRLEALGTAPLKPYLAQIEAARSRSDLIDLFAAPGFASPVNVAIFADRKDPTRYGAYAFQGGLGLPNRDYYLLQGEKYDGYRKAYRDYLIDIQTLAGIGDAATRAGRIIALETEIAKAHWTPEKNRDVEKTYNKMDRAKLMALAPQFDWGRFLDKQGLGKAAEIIVAQPDAIASEGRLFASVPLHVWKDWLAVRFISSAAPFLSKAFDDAQFSMYSKTLNGVQSQRDRWKRGVDIVSDVLGEGVGEIYVQRHYPAESSRQMGELIANFRAALQEKIETSAWMDAPTKTEALAKLATFDPRTGHPKRYVDYSALDLKADDLFGNMMRAQEFGWDLLLSRFPNPVDRDLWVMTPQTNNAYYDSTTNQITFPAAILQPPYFDPKADAASNYGSIGATIGHEIGHGFDDQGRKSDAKGMLRDWWTPASAKAYTAQADKLVKQYSEFEPVAGTKIKGALSLGENLGDLGGLEVAYAAYRKHVAANGEPPVIDGFTGDQRFFIAYGYSWQTKYRDDRLRSMLLTGPHSPAKFRVNGVVRNMDAWYRAFNVQPGDKMYLPPEQRATIW